MDSDYWDKVAGPTWVAGQAQMDLILARYAETLADAMTLPAGATLVDVGCGCGATTRMARQHSPEATIIAVDVSRPMLGVAEATARAAGDTRTRFILGDASHEDLGAGSVDRIISRFGVMFFADPIAAFSNLRRWLKPDATMVLVVWGERANNPWMTDMVAVLGQHLELAPPDPNGPGPFSLGNPEHRRQVFSAASLRVTEELSLRDPVRVDGTLDELVTFYAQRGPVATAVAEAPQAARDNALAHLRQAIEARYDGSGVSLPAHALRLTLARTDG